MANEHSVSAHQAELWREAAVMMLYLSVVEIAELASLPEGHGSGGQATGPSGLLLLEILWGTAVGLALAHWFAFRIAAPAFRGDKPSKLDNQIGLVQLAGAAAVALVSSLPVLLLSPERAQDLTGDVPALIIGVIGYLLARATGKGRLRSVAWGVVVLALGVAVALIKSYLGSH